MISATVSPKVEVPQGALIPTLTLPDHFSRAKTPSCLPTNEAIPPVYEEILLFCSKTESQVQNTLFKIGSVLAPLGDSDSTKGHEMKLMHRSFQWR